MNALAPDRGRSMWPPAVGPVCLPPGRPVALQESFILGWVASTRHLEEAAHTVGSFVNVLPLVLTAIGSLSLADLASNAQAALAAAQANADVFLAKILADADAPAIEAVLDFSVRAGCCCRTTPPVKQSAALGDHGCSCLPLADSFYLPPEKEV